MSIFSKAKATKHNSQKLRISNSRPRLNILATKPSVASDPETAEWILDLCIPPVVESKATIAQQPQRSHSYSKLFQHHKKDNTEQPTPVLRHEESTTEAVHYYFSRLHPDSHTEERPKDVILQIFLTSFPASDPSQRTCVDLLIQMNKVLETVYLTPTSSLWLRQALFALQAAEVIPPASNGLDLAKFMSFGTSYLEQRLREQDQSQVKEVNYSKVLRENERLKQIFSSDSTDYTTMTSVAQRTDELGDDEDLWNLPVRGKPIKDGKAWGGFWVTHGSGGSSSRNSSQDRGVSEPPRRRDVYGGLM